MHAGCLIAPGCPALLVHRLMKRLNFFGLSSSCPFTPVFHTNPPGPHIFAPSQLPWYCESKKVDHLWVSKDFEKHCFTLLWFSGVLLGFNQAALSLWTSVLCQSTTCCSPHIDCTGHMNKCHILISSVFCGKLVLTCSAKATRDVSLRQ